MTTTTTTILLKKRLDYRFGVHLNPNIPYKAHWDGENEVWMVHSCETVRLAVNPKFVLTVIEAEPVMA